MSTGFPSIYIPYTVYQNLYEFAKYVGVTLNAKTQLSRDDFTKRMNNYEYILIKGKVNNKTTNWFLINHKSAYGKTTDKFKKLLKNIKASELHNSELMIVSEEAINTHLQNYLKKIKQAAKNIHISHYTYSMFIIVKPRHVSWQKHTVVKKDEEEQFLEANMIVRDNLPKILKDDPGVVWCGARVGDIVKINRGSETAGKATAYRLVI